MVLIAAVVMTALLVWAPSRAAAQAHIGRTLGGAAGVAAGAFAGTSIASAVISAAGIASLGPAASILVGGGIIVGCGLVGGKAFSALGELMERRLGPRATWIMLGASIGAIAAMALLPATGIFAGAAGVALKGLIGGVAGGVFAEFFSDDLEAYATPRTIYAVTGGVLGAATGAGFVGSAIGAAGGYALGSVMDDEAFVDVDGRCGRRPTLWRRARDRYRLWRENVEDWYYGKEDCFKQRLPYDDTADWYQASVYYGDYGDQVYVQTDDGKVRIQIGRDPYQQAPAGWQDPYYDDFGKDKGYEMESMPRVSDEQRRRVMELKRKWMDALRRFEEYNSDSNTDQKQMYDALQEVRHWQKKYYDALEMLEGVGARR